MNGFDFIAQFRELPQAATVPILVWTVKDASERQRLLCAGTATVVFEGDDGAGALFDEVALLSRSLAEGAAHAR